MKKRAVNHVSLDTLPAPSYRLPLFLYYRSCAKRRARINAISYAIIKKVQIQKNGSAPFRVRVICIIQFFRIFKGFLYKLYAPTACFSSFALAVLRFFISFAKRTLNTVLTNG